MRRPGKFSWPEYQPRTRGLLVVKIF